MRYDQPFCIIGSRGKFKGSSFGYLSPIEPPEEITLLEATPEKTELPNPEWRQVQWNYVKQLENKVLFLQKKIVELQNIRNKKGKETITGIIPME